MTETTTTTNTSLCGKLAVVLFYSFVVLQIIGGIWSVVAPTIGWDCLWGVVSPSDLNMILATMKVLNIWIVGFMIYAYINGVKKIWNIGLVWFIYLLQWLMYKPVITEFLQNECPDELTQMKSSIVVTQIWISLALVCGIIDKYGGSSNGTSEESTPLIV